MTLSLVCAHGPAANALASPMKLKNRQFRTQLYLSKWGSLLIDWSGNLRPTTKGSAGSIEDYSWNPYMRASPRSLDSRLPTAITSDRRSLMTSEDPTSRVSTPSTAFPLGRPPVVGLLTCAPNINTRRRLPRSLTPRGTLLPPRSEEH